MTKEQIAQLPDDVRIPTELLLDRLDSIPSLKIINSALSEDGGIAFYFEEEKGELKMTADIEIDSDGTITASVIPYINLGDGYDVFQSEDEPIELWDVEEPPPFDETIRHIHERFNIALVEQV
jgi:hypothetical protein